MKYHYVHGATRWFRFTGPGDVRLHRAPRGWEAKAVVIDQHPLTGKSFKQAQWWVCETYKEF